MEDIKLIFDTSLSFFLKYGIYFFALGSLVCILKFFIRFMGISVHDKTSNRRRNTTNPGIEIEEHDSISYRSRNRTNTEEEEYYHLFESE